MRAGACSRFMGRLQGVALDAKEQLKAGFFDGDPSVEENVEIALAAWHCRAALGEGLMYPEGRHLPDIRAFPSQLFAKT